MRRRGAAVAALVGGLAVLSPTGAWGQTPVTIPAPPGTAEAVALEIEGIVAIARTAAEATTDPATTKATANALELGDSPLLDLGGTQTGPGTNEGELLDTGDIGIGRLAVAPFKAAVEGNAALRKATAEAALLRLVLLSPDTLTVDLLQSFSQATHSGNQSTGEGSSDGAVITLLGPDGINLVLLHSEGSSLNGGSSFLIGLNDTQLISDEDLGNSLEVLDLPGLLTLGLIDVGGGAGTGLSEATGLDLNVLDNTLNALVSDVVATGSPLAAPAPTELPAGEPGGGGGGGGGLPRTGASILALLAVGTGLVGGGSILFKASRRRQVAGF